MTELISQKDIDGLLDVLNVEDDSDDLSLADAPSSDVGSSGIRGFAKNVKVYDFKSPDKFSKDQLRTLQMIYENYARAISTTISTYLRKLVVVNVSSVDQISYEQFTKTVMNPTTLVLINMYPLKGSAIMEIPPTLTFAIIERLLGGEGEMIKNTRELTDIELSVIESVAVRLLINLKDSWSSIIEFKPKLDSIETNIQFTQIVPPNDTVVLITLDARIGRVEGSLLFCIPYITLESIINRLSARNIYISLKQEEESNQAIIREHMFDTNVEARVEIGEMPISVDELLDLKEGDFIELETKANAMLPLYIGGKRKFLVKPGKRGKKMAVVISAVSKRDEKQDDFLREIGGDDL